ncbi:MAG: UvrD-helicase domain-containing protein [Alphaproteobacteria bacterium]
MINKVNEAQLADAIKLQQIASDPKNNAWVFASAGSGKTKILSDRVLRLLLENTAPNKILCLTFTKVGANEMTERINQELANWVIIDEEELLKKLTNLTGQIPNNLTILKARKLFVEVLDSEKKINIQTIHSFCKSLLNIFPFEAKIPLNFELLEENQGKLMLQKARQEVFKNAENDEGLQKIIADIFSEISEESLEEMILQILSQKEKINRLQIQTNNFRNFPEIIENILQIDSQKNQQGIISEFYQELELEAITMLIADLENSGKRNIETAKKIAKFLNNPNTTNFQKIISGFFNDEGNPRKLYGDIGKIKLEDKYSNLCQQTREIIEIYEQKLISLDIVKNTVNLINLIAKVLDNYQKIKKNNSFLDYDDLILQTNKLLENPEFSSWVKMKMDGNFDHILIDESQDTNMQQWQIIKALSEDFFSGESKANKHRSIFIVGDEKQSIYSFQGSEPDISSKIYKYFSNKLGENLKKIELNNSFRSTKEVLALVDEIFKQQQYSKAICKVSNFENHRPIRLGNGQVTILKNICFSELSENSQKQIHDYFLTNGFNLNNNTDEKIADSLILAEIIAKKIRSWIDNKKILSNKNRPVRFDDIMILLRNRTNKLPRELSQAFHRYQIPFSSTARIKFKDSLIIQDLLSIANFVCLNIDDLNLVHLLKSPFFNYNEEQIFWLCQDKNDKNKPIIEVIKNPQTLDLLNNFISLSQKFSAYDFYFFILNKQNFRENFYSRFGDQALQIFEKFLLKLNDFSQDQNLSLHKLLDLIDKIDPDINLDSFASNSVKITTVHSAKGLQSPIVIIPDCNHDLSRSADNKDHIYWLDHSQISIPMWCKKDSNKHYLIDNLKQIKKELRHDEYLRLLYVALTRAEDELYISGFGKTTDQQSWYNIIVNSLNNDMEIEENQQLIDFLCYDQFSNTAFNDKNNSQITLDDLQKNSFSNIALDIENKEQEQQKHFNFNSQIQGEIIHNILEIIGNNYQQPKSFLINLSQKLLDNNNFIDNKTKKTILNLIDNFISSNQFQEIFKGKVDCELEITDGLQFYRIDLLSNNAERILIIDYKSDEFIDPQNILKYQQQLQQYQKIISKIYSTKKVEIAILWLKNLNLQFL